MQQKYMVGAAIILLGIAATGFLIDENARGRVQEPGSQSAISPGGALVTTNNNSSDVQLPSAENKDANRTGDGGNYQLVINSNGSLEKNRLYMNQLHRL